MTTTAAEFLKAADPAAALKALSDDVRAKPSDSRHRVFMAQLLCVLGQWERALNQLTVAAELDALAVPMKQMYGDAVRCEGLRADVFAGKRTPMIFGQPDEWLALLIESLLRQGRGESELAEDLRQRAFDGAPAIGGTIDPSNGWPTPTCAWARCSRPSSTASTTGFRMRGSRTSRSIRPKTCATACGCPRTCSSRTAAKRSR